MNLIPPDQLVKDNAIGEGDFSGIGESMAQGLIGRGFVNPSSRILDIGCGLGRLARPLVKYLATGEYYGLDINQSSIDWCSSNYAPYPNFHFGWINAFSKFYNPAGAFAAAEYSLPYAGEFFDFVMLTSVFTHMMRNDVDNYLSEISRVLKPGGRCYATYFLLTPEYKKSFKSQPQYFPIDGGFVSDKDMPEKVVFLDECIIRELYAKYQLSIASIGYGSWSGRKVVGGYQDEIVATKTPGHD